MNGTTKRGAAIIAHRQATSVSNPGPEAAPNSGKLADSTVYYVQVHLREFHQFLHGSPFLANNPGLSTTLFDFCILTGEACASVLTVILRPDGSRAYRKRN